MLLDEALDLAVTAGRSPDPRELARARSAQETDPFRGPRGAYLPRLGVSGVDVDPGDEFMRKRIRGDHERAISYECGPIGDRLDDVDSKSHLRLRSPLRSRLRCERFGRFEVDAGRWTILVEVFR